MNADWGRKAAGAVLRVDGGMSANDWTMQFLADAIGAPVDRPKVLETTALGVAWLAGQHSGFYPDQAGFANEWEPDRRFRAELLTKTCGRAPTQVGKTPSGELLPDPE